MGYGAPSTIVAECSGQSSPGVTDEQDPERGIAPRSNLLDWSLATRRTLNRMTSNGSRTREAKALSQTMEVFSWMD